jgi:predicted aconitase
MKSVWLSLSAGEIVRLLKSDKDALRELSAAIASEPKLRLAVINAVLADVAAKQQLRQELKGGDSAVTGGDRFAAATRRQ